MKQEQQHIHEAEVRVQGKVGAAFTSIGGHGRGFGGHEVILQQFHATFLQHGMVRSGPSAGYSHTVWHPKQPTTSLPLVRQTLPGARAN
jgi:multimeric flavodoxin WrbA